MRKLIVTADDFGADLAVNEAVEEAHRKGVLTAASLMVGAPAAQDAVRRARALPSLRVGLHLALVEAKPVLPPEEVPGLVDGSGYFRTDMARSGAQMFFLPSVRAQLAREMEAQFAAFAATGLALDHVNAHKHFHLHPTIASLMIGLSRRYGAPGARVPLEPRDVLAQVEAPGGAGLALLTTPFAALLRHRFRRAGLCAPDAVFGLAWSGAVTPDRLAGLIPHLPEGLSEIYLHPATGAYPGSAPGYRYTEELAALCDPRVKAQIAAGDIRLGGFCDFPVH